MVLPVAPALHPSSLPSLCCHLISWLSCNRNSCPWLGRGWSLFTPALPLSANEGRRWEEGGRVRLNLFLSSFTSLLRFHESTALGSLGESGKRALCTVCWRCMGFVLLLLSPHIVPSPFYTGDLMVFPGSGLIDRKVNPCRH